jgi:pimeloyl-ACP methyl ester carboxylesterase
VRRLTVPARIITGEKTYRIGQLIDSELARVVPAAERTIIPNGTHDMCSENPLACAEAIHKFVSKSAG